MRKALIVGIDHYEHIETLTGCVNDAYAVKAMLDRHANGSVNFGSRLIVGTGPQDIVERTELREAVQDLFADKGDIALFYFAGHGHIESTGGYLCAGDCRSGHDGLALSEIMTWVNASPVLNKIVILDSCHSGAIGAHPSYPSLTEISEGVTILTASKQTQRAMEDDHGGVFTNLFIDALGGAASNLMGEVTPGSVYAHIDQSLGAFAQRPVFKTNVTNFVSLRSVQPPLELADLQRISELFPTPGHEFALDPTYEDSDPSAIPEHTVILKLLQKYHRVNLAVPVGVEFPYFAAMESKGMKLTALGEHYRRLAAENLI